MEHRLVANIEKALGWSGPADIGTTFVRGDMPDTEVCGRLLTPQRLLDLVMRRSLAPHRLQCLVDGEFVHPQRYLITSAARRGQTPMAHMQKLGQLLKSGCTLVVDEINTYDPTLEVACRALQWWAHELVQANVYLTTGEAAGFQRHWDDHDVLIVQLAGEKTWEIRGPSRPAPMYRDGAPNLEPPEEIIWSGTLRAGQVMHIPRGCWHQATRQERGDGYSLHVTFGLIKRTGTHWMTWLADQTRHQELFRHDIARWASIEDRKAQHLEFVDAAVRLVTSGSLTDYLHQREHHTGRALGTSSPTGSSGRRSRSSA
jgi:ribosomal protein L16 Arg81 hydroxylase